MRPHDEPGHLDFVACSAHKMYAPFGTGALIGSRSAFGRVPDHTGGGTVHAVTTSSVAWADLPDREEAGSPNVIGAIALAVATRTLTEMGLDRIAAHEIELTRYALRRLSTIPGLTIHGPAEDTDSANKLGIISFTIDWLDPALIAAVLGYEHGIGVRAGCFCAHPYVGHLLGLDGTESASWFDRARQGDKRGAPGMVRISFGCYNDSRDVDVAVAALEQLITGEIASAYQSDRDGSFHPVDYIEPALFCWTGRDRRRRKELQRRLLTKPGEPPPDHDGARCHRVRLRQLRQAVLADQDRQRLFSIDFLLRTAGLERSPSGVVAGWMTRRRKPQWVSAKPKRFAWSMGLTMALGMTVISNSSIHGALPKTICLICLTLIWMEAVLGLCLGCEIYGVMVRRGWRARDDAFEICVNGACDAVSKRA
jgi:hypothetical protein